MDKTVGFVGGGRITKILLTGFKKADSMPDTVVVSDKNVDVLNSLKEDFPDIETAHDDNKTAAAQDIVFIAVHPPVMGKVLDEIKSSLKPGSTIISLAPKVKIAKISEILGDFSNIVRLIPNASSIMNNGYNPVSFSHKIINNDKKELLELFKVLGDCPEVDEDKLEAYVILTAMGPTYFWFQLDELQKLGKSFGLDGEELREGILSMFTGAAKTFYQSELTPNEVMDLIPVKPMESDENAIRTAYQLKLEFMFDKLKG